METWSVIYHVHSDSYRGHDPFAHFTFQAENMDDAKQKLLELVKKRVKRLRQWRGRWFYIQAGPYIMIGNQRVLDGDRMIRVRDSYSKRKILRVKNPDLAFVCGYGPTQAEALRT